MDDAFQMMPQFAANGKGGADTSGHMFGMMDDLSANFRDELQTAKSHLSKKEKVTGSKEKNTDEAPAKETEAADKEASAKEAKVAAEEEGAATEESVKQASLLEAAPELLADSESADEIGPEAVIQDKEVQEASPEEIVADEAYLVDTEEIVESDSSSIEEEVTIEAKPEVEAAVIDEAPEEEAVDAESETAKVVPVELESTPVEKSEVVEASIEEKSSHKNEQVAVQDQKPVETAFDQTKTESEVAIAKKEELPKVKAEVSRQEIAKPVEVKAQPTAVQIAEPEIVDETPENFHSIIPEAEVKEATTGIKSPGAPLTALDPEQAARIAHSLSQLAERTKLQAPNAERVSPQLLEGLKSSNAPIAKQLEGAKAPAQSSAGVGTSDQAKAAVKLTEARPIDRLYTDPRMEELKQKVIEQVRFQMRMAIKGKANEIQMKLNPRVLGEVKIELVIEQAQAKAQFHVENQSVKELLMRSIGQLQESFAQEGIDLSEIDVSVSDNQDGGSGKAFASAEEQQAARDFIASFANLAGARGSGTEEQAEEDREATDPDQVLNIVA